MLPMTRIWSLLLVVSAVAGVAIAMIGTRMIDERSEDAARAALVRDRFELEALLKLDARARIDALATLAADGAVRTALRTATGRSAGAEIDEAVATTLRSRLQEVNGHLGELAGDLVFGVDATGIIVGQYGGGTPPPHGAGLGAFPLVRRALDGYVRDDVWVYNGEVYRMAARPVIDAGQYVGAVVSGKRFDDTFCTRLASRLSGASVGFFLRDQFVASAMPDSVVGAGAPRRDDLAGPLATVIAAEAWNAGQLSDVQTLPTGGLAVFAPVVGGAAHAHFGYALGRSVEVLGRPTAILDLASGQDWAALPWPVLGGVAFLLFLIAFLSSWLEHNRPLTKFRAATDKLGRRELDRLVATEFGGELRSSAASINDALDKVQDTAGGARRKAADLDQILGKQPETSSPAFFGFGGSAAANAEFELPPAPPAPATTASAPTPPAPPAAPPAPPAAKAAPPAPPAAPPAAPPTAKPAVPAPPAAKPAVKPQDPLGTTMLGVGSPLAQGSGPVQAAAVRPAPIVPMPVAPSQIEGGDDEDGATMIARVPDELLKRAGSEEAEQEAHYREVFEQFLATKKQCNEAVVGLTFEKFVVTLRKNREQIVAKHGASKVRFTVYVKEGKAALKATPIKE